MAESKVSGYIRISPKNPNIEDDIASMKQRFPQLSMYEERKIRGFVAAEERPVLQKMLSELNSGDTVIVWWLDVLGGHFADVRDTICKILDKGAKLHTVNQELVLQQGSPETEAQLALLEGMASSEKRRRLAYAEISRQALRQNPDEWAKKFQGRRANKELHHQIATLLLEGKTLQATADETGASISTVKRVKSKLKQKAESPEMKLRG
ncbi:recombinase family protein [Vibrio sp. JC009]|uniref:recombinase family protein n=1 Tax=Vibrio sp. JC009 TaxID=2912314 RepID=UPI0023B1FBEE|nr:recombinase family protein [Vibrio sp. JC009]WED22546.1 recombinase family protein [Vibrio sp. JC009]